MAAATVVAFPASAYGQRSPLTVQPLTRIDYGPTAARLRFDPVQRTLVKYEVDGRIDFLRTSGNFLLSWNGSDGTRQERIWEPPNKLSAVVAADVTFDGRTGLYTYSYTVSNAVESVQKLNTVYIGGGDIDQGFGPNARWYSRALTPFLRATFATDGWAWSQVSEGDGVAPGETVSGFRITSRSPPGIVRVYVEGQRPGLQAAENLPDELHAAIDQVYLRLPAGSTIGPVLLSVAQTPQAQLEALSSLVSEAERQGWLGNETSASNVRRSLTAIRASGMAGDMSRAREQTSNLLRSLRTSQYEGILSEGRALLEHRLPLHLEVNR